MKLSFFALLFLILSCKKESICETCNTETGFKDAVIVDGGPMETDGCGWLVKIEDDKYYHPDSLEDEFKQNDLRVRICYEMSAGKFICGIAAIPIPVIRLLAIKK